MGLATMGNAKDHSERKGKGKSGKQRYQRPSLVRHGSLIVGAHVFNSPAFAS